MVRAQNDAYMVVNNNGAEINSNGDNTEAAIIEGRLTVGELQRASMNILRFILVAPVIERELIDTNTSNQHQMQNMKFRNLQMMLRLNLKEQIMLQLKLMKMLSTQ